MDMEATQHEPQPREIPAGKILLADYGTYDKSECSIRTNLATGTKNGRECTLYRNSPGFERAGSVARWTNGAYGVQFWMDNSTHGRMFSLTDEGLAKARELFAAWTMEDE